MPIRLDNRLSAVASLVHGGSVADIGCDHGKLSYYLLSTDRADRVIATDISAASLKKARELADINGADIETRLGDGLGPIGSREVDTVIIAGLGGDVIAGIIAGAEKEGKSFSHYIISVNTHAERVRRQLIRTHTIVVDRQVECQGKLYTLIKTDEGASQLDDNRLEFGAFYFADDLALRQMREELDYKRKLLAANPSSESLRLRVALLEGALSHENGV